MERIKSTERERTNPSPEVLEKPVRRRFTVEHKVRILADADAIAPHPEDAWSPDLGKEALLPGEWPTTVNYTKGLNGIMIDLARSPTAGTITTADFLFEVGHATTWEPAPAASIQVEAGGVQIATDSYGRFTFDIPELVNGIPNTVSARAVYRDQQADIYLTGGWSDLTFTPNLPTFQQAAITASTFALQYDTGSVTNDGITNDPTVKGQLDSPIPGTIIEFNCGYDVNQNGVPDNDALGVPDGA